MKIVILLPAVAVYVVVEKIKGDNKCESSVKEKNSQPSVSIGFRSSNLTNCGLKTVLLICGCGAQAIYIVLSHFI